MTNDTFLHLRLIGARFDRHSIPLTVFKDLAVLEEMIVEVAKHRFRSDHPERQRTPRGFTRNMELRLATIESGSAVLGIRLGEAELFPPTNHQYFEHARDEIVETVRAAQNGHRIDTYSTTFDLMSIYFDRFGRSLKENEAVEFISPNRERAMLTQDIRRRLVRASPRIVEITESISIRCLVPEMDQKDMTFEVQTSEGRRISAPIPVQHLDTVLEGFNGYSSEIRVLLQGIGSFSRAGRLLGFVSIEHVSILDSLDVGVQVDELRLVEDGWLEGWGTAPSEAGLDWLLEVFDRHFPEDAPLPHLYPTEAGGVQAEWSLGSREVTLELDLETHKGEWHVLDVKSGEVQERVLNCDRDEEWTWLIEQIGAVNRGEG